MKIDRFIHLPEFYVIIYKEYKYAILPSYINTHFIGEPYKLDKKECQRIADKVAEVNRLIINKEVLYNSKFLFLVATSKLIKGLAKLKRDIF